MLRKGFLNLKNLIYLIHFNAGGALGFYSSLKLRFTMNYQKRIPW